MGRHHSDQHSISEHLEVTADNTESATYAIGNVPASSVIFAVHFFVLEAYAATSEIEVGVNGAPDLFVAGSAVDLTALGYTRVAVEQFAGAAQDIEVTRNATVSATGAVKVLFEFVQPVVAQ